MDKENPHIKGTLELFEESEKEKEKYEITFMNKKFIVHPHVFSPKYFKSPQFSIENIPINKGEVILEIGCGVGIFPIIAISKGASKVTATDISPDAVENAKENVTIYNLNDKIQIIQSDVYENIPKGSKFDLIFWNVPFMYVEGENVTLLEKSCFDDSYKSIKKFIVEAKNYLRPNGRLILEFSKTLGNYDKIKEFFEEADMDFKEIKKEVVDYGETLGDVEFELFEAKPRKL